MPNEQSTHRITHQLIAGRGASGDTYMVEFAAADLGEANLAHLRTEGGPLYLWLIEVEMTGREVRYGPFPLVQPMSAGPRAQEARFFLPWLSSGQ